MKDINEGETSLLDNSIFLSASSLVDGDVHRADRLPIVLAGKGGGSLQTGRILDYTEKGDENRKVCSLHLSLMDRLGVKLDRFGDVNTRSAGLEETAAKKICSSTQGRRRLRPPAEQGFHYP